MASPREHVEEIRRKKFSIGSEENPLTEDLHQAVKNLSAELYAKDVHFLMELIQNAEDNEYSESVDPSLEFVITSKDITATGAPATLLIFNNEIGFSPKNIESICSVGRSTKKGNRKKGYIGEKGIGFKSVFLITSRPYIFSNGYKIRFNEEPCQHCNVGYIVPEWVDQNPNLSELTTLYSSGSGSSLPTTILILPLKPDKVNPVKQQLSSLHPQVLLFLSKIKRLSVREHYEDRDSGLDTVNGIAITKETDFKQSKSIDAESFTLHLCADENGIEKECSYYMWKQKFPVPSGFRVERRSEVDEWVITLAFPNGESLDRGSKSPGIYAFLPTEMVTNFPFIVQADFLLASSRETILLDEKWNKGILECLPQAFVNAFKSLVEAHREAPARILPNIFRFLPLEESNYRKLNLVREAIRSKLAEEEVVPSEVVVKQKFFHKPREVGRLVPSFWKILEKAKSENVKLLSLSSHGRYVLSSHFDREEFDRVLDFLRVQPIDNKWYGKCILGSKLVEKVSEDVYLEILLFVAENWSSKFHCTNIANIPLIKYEDSNGAVSLFSISENSSSSVYLSRHLSQASWLIGWNGEFSPVTNLFFAPKATQEAINSSLKKETLSKWLREKAKLGSVDVNEFASIVSRSLKKERKLIVSYAHFLFHSLSKKKFLSEDQVDRLCVSMPILDSYEKVSTQRKGVLVPANGSKWAELVLSNLWKEDGYVELSKDYLTPFHVGGKLVTPENGLVGFLKEHGRAEDVPSIPLPNRPIPSVSSTLTKENAFLLLEWVRNQKSNRVSIPSKFSESVREGSWLRITLNGSPGSRPPRESFLLSTSVLVDVPLVDQSFYGEEIKSYRDELREVGVMLEFSEACLYIGNQLMSLASSGALMRNNFLSILKFIKFLRVKCLPPDDFIKSIKKGKWMRTWYGEKSPSESVLFDEENWKTASKISNISFIDQSYYGEEIREFEKELELLGVVVGFSHKIVIDNLKPSSSFNYLSPEVLLLALQCTRCDNSSENKISKALRDAMCLKTIVGYKKPGETILCDPEWGCLFQVFDALPLIDPDFYGVSLINYRAELKLIGVMVDFDLAAKALVKYFQERVSSKSIYKDNAISVLKCYRQLKESNNKFHLELEKCFYEAKWLRTRHCDYYRSPKECVLFSQEWKPISPIAHLPFIDDSENWYGSEIFEYKKELKSMGVVVDFNDGAKFVVDGLYFHDVTLVTCENALSLLECVSILREEKSYKFPEEFSKKMSRAWLRTKAGYKSPDKCLLFDSKFGKYLKETDGPFIDEEFYGPKISSYREVLSSIGVIVDFEKGCSLIANQIESHSEFSTILRLYDYLSIFSWEAKSEADKKIWIPSGSHRGWAKPQDCVVSDKSELFGSQMIILDKYYEKNLFFFTSAFKVKQNPCTEDYCKLWKSWENSGHELTHEECCKFWGYVTNHWNSKTEKTLTDELAKVPVKSSADGIFLMNKSDVFIADDLQLKDLFDKSCPRSIFVWYPQLSSPSLSRTKLLEIYQKIGVRTISESAEREEVSMLSNGNEKDQKVVPNHVLIGKGLVKLILGFLANPNIRMEAKERHKALGALLKLTVIETVEPIDVSYKLLQSDGILKVKASRMVRWERESSKIFVQKKDSSKGPRDLIERATYFSEVIAEGVLWENGDHIHELTELIKMAFLLNLDEVAIDFLMKSKNFQIFVEDEIFMSSAFPASY